MPHDSNNTLNPDDGLINDPCCRMADYQSGDTQVEQQGYDDQQGQYGQESYDQQDQSYAPQDQPYAEQKESSYPEDNSGGYQNQNTP